MQKKKISNGTLAAIIVLAIIIADQVIKIWVKTSFRLGESMPFTNWAELYFIENPGMAFGIELGGKLFLSIFRIFASVALVYFLFKIRKNEAYPKSFVVCLSMVTAGAIGNVIDGMFYGLIFSESTWYSVATLFPEGGGYGVPLNYVWDEADAIYIHCAPEGRKLHCLRECDRVTFCIVGKTQVLPARFTTFYESILLDCRARTGLTAEERRRALDHLIGKYSPEYKTIGRQYVEKSFHRTEIIRLDILSWSGKCKDNLHPGTTPPGANSNRT